MVVTIPVWVLFLIGIDSNGNLHRAAQITLGILIEDYPFTTGLTIGYKWFRKFDNSGENSWERYNYYDLQSHALESIFQPGIGFGLIQGHNMSLTPRFKLWSNLIFFLPSYEFIDKKMTPLNITLVYLEFCPCQ